VMKPRRYPHTLPPPPHRLSSMSTSTGSPPGTSSVISDAGTGAAASGNISGY
jgi:hypothetical protein